MQKGEGGVTAERDWAVGPPAKEAPPEAGDTFRGRLASQNCARGPTVVRLPRLQ